ncbi:MAG: asparagine synthase-related protein, partial [Pseudomonadota bacterium]|nr:asparagine synthase-related protein [Pseudomonadota bacterium]
RARARRQLYPHSARLMYRFLACIWDVEDREAALQAASFTAQLGTSTGPWRTVMNTPGQVVLCTGSDGPTWQTYPLAADGGVVLGTLFQRARDGASSPSSARFDDDESRAIIHTQGDHLVRRYWGRYVAFLRDPLAQRQYVLRDPTGLLPCYSARIQSVDVYFSWLADAVQLGVSATRIDFDYARAWLKSRLAYGRRTGLTDVSQVLGGECVTHDHGKVTHALLWNPLRECAPQTEDSAYAAAELRRVTRDVVQAWANRYPSLMLALSGGLDSSIVSACLRDVSAVTKYINAVTSGAGDERAFAKAVARKAGCELLEQHRTAADVNLESLLLAPACPEPMDYLAWLEHTSRDAPMAHKLEAGAIFSGNGGDEIFGRTGAVWAVKDFARQHGIRASLFGRAMDAARQDQRSVWKVLRTALHAQWDPDSEVFGVIRSDAANVTRDDLGAHPALRGAPSHLPCGKWRHAYLLTAPSLMIFDPITVPTLERVMPLRSQPLLELCLRIPTYILIAEGWDRALARRAFCSDLPPEIVSRRTKGEISEYVLDLFNGNLPFIKHLLLNGRLVSEGLVERQQLVSLLSMSRSRDQTLVAQMMDCIDIEVWLRTRLPTGARHST